ncbi:MAG: hypothetical protein EOP86_07845 [Verrucomicrobiaceae bacterium]|nr:MAG: hypothetical protein EOP86_07845 [Verrucomicrobiaceae bacterium]
MKSTAILAMVLGLAGFQGGRWWFAPVPARQTAVAEPALGTATNAANATAPEGALPIDPRPSKEDVLGAGDEKRLGLLLRWLAGATAGEVAEMASALEAAYYLDGGMWAAVAARWAEVDPDAAILYARRRSAEVLDDRDGASLRGVNIRVKSLDVYKSLLRLNPELALAKLPEEPPKILDQLLRQLKPYVEKTRRESWAAANARLAEASVWAAKPDEEAEAARRSRGMLNMHSLSPEAKAIQDLILAKDLAGGRVKIDAMPQTFQRAMLELDYAAALAAQKSPQEAADWAKANLKGLAKSQAIILAARELGKTDPMKALAMLRDNKIADLGTALVGVIEVKTSGSSSTGYRRNQDMGAMAEVISTAAKTDPKAAMDYLLSSGGILPRDMRMRYVDNDDRSNNGSLGRAIYKQWVESDPRAAALWLAGQPSSSKGLAEMLPLVAGPLSARDGAEGRAFVLSLPQGPVRQELIGYAAAEWAMAGDGGDGAGDALQWAANAGGAPALSAAFEELIQKNAEVAGQNFSLLPPETQAVRLQSLTDALGRQKPQALPQLYASLPQEVRTEVDLRNALTSLAKQNVEQASAWLDGIPGGKARDSGISGLVDYLISAPQPDPEAAAHWAAASADPAAHDRRLQRVAEAWKKQDPTGAAAAIQSSGLAEPVRQQLLGYLAAPKTGN